MTEIKNYFQNEQTQVKQTPQLRRKRGSNSLTNILQTNNSQFLNSASQVDINQQIPKKEKQITTIKFKRSYSQLLKEIDELKPQKQQLSTSKVKQNYMEMKSNKSQRQRVDQLYNQLSQKYRLQKVSKEELFQKNISQFKGLKTFVDLKQQIQEMNIMENKDFQKNLEILKIRERVSQLNEELNKNNLLEDEDGVQQLKFKENMLNSIKKNYDASQIKSQRQFFFKKLTSFLNNDTKIEVMDENCLEWSKLPGPLHSYLKNLMIKQKKSRTMKIREEEIKQNIHESQKEKEFRQKILESQYDLNGQSQQKFPQNQYYETFKRKTDQIILDAKKQLTKEFRKSFLLTNSNISNNQSKQGAPLSPTIKDIKNQNSNLASSDNFFLTENINGNNNSNKILPLSKIQSQSNSSQGSAVSSIAGTPRYYQSYIQHQQVPEMKSKFIDFKKKARSSTVDDAKSQSAVASNDLRSKLYQNTDSQSFKIRKPYNSLEKISRQVSKIMYSYKEDVQKIQEERERKEQEGLNSSSILNGSLQAKYIPKNDKLDQSIQNIQNNSLRSNSLNIYFRQKSDHILTVQRGVMKKFLQQVEQAEDCYQIEKSEINNDLKVIQEEQDKYAKEIKEANQFNWEGFTKEELSNQVVNHYLFSRLRQRRIKSLQEFLRQSKISKATN
ncbi:hypothetical protein ABPG72_003559 [Tetrahymena utriculariae]